MQKEERLKKAITLEKEKLKRTKNIPIDLNASWNQRQELKGLERSNNLPENFKASSEIRIKSFRHINSALRELGLSRDQ